MAFAILSFILILCIYSCIKKPGIAISYVLLFQSLNQILFDEIGLYEFRYGMSIIIFLTTFLFHCSKKQIRYNFSNFAKNKIVIGYMLLSAYVVIYALFFGSSYEREYLNKFVFPGAILFSAGALFVFKETMYKEMIHGTIIFLVISLTAQVLLFGFDVLSPRLYIGENPGMGAISQGRMAGLLALLALVILNSEQRFNYTTVFLILIGLIWLSMTGTRGAFVSLIASICFYIFNRSLKVIQKKKIMIAVLILVPILIYYGISESLLFARGTELLDPDELQGIKRYFRWLLFLKLVPEHFILGLGPGGWGKYVMIGDFRYPHNIIIEAVIEFGLIGVISLGLICVTSVKKLIEILKNPFSSVYIQCLSLAWIYIFFNTMFSGSFIQGNVTFFTLSGVMVSFDNWEKSSGIAIREIYSK